MERKINKIYKYAFLALGIAGIAGAICGNMGHLFTAAAGIIVYLLLKGEEKEESESSRN